MNPVERRHGPHARSWPRAAAAIAARLSAILLQEDINFLLTNRIPRRYATLFMNWWSRLEQPLVRDLSIALFQMFADELHLEEAKKREFRSLHDCFIRELADGARPINPDPNTLVSPCDGDVGAVGRIEGTRLYQLKGFPYTLDDLLGDPELIDRYRDGSFITLRLRANMYHRFHAPHDCDLTQVRYFSGDTWNVNPIALRRVERLFCKNERVALPLRLHGSAESVTLVAVASILVASIKLHDLPQPLDLRYKGQNRLPCSARFRKGQEMGYFELGSTILVFASPGLTPCDHVREGRPIRVGEPLLQHLGPRSP